MAHGDKSKSNQRIGNTRYRKGWDYIFNQTNKKAKETQVHGRGNKKSTGNKGTNG